MSGPVDGTWPSIRIVLVNFDGGAITRRCLDAIAVSTYPADRREVVVVDNASVDGLIWELRTDYPWVRVIESNTNEGFARGCNLALADLDGIDFVALINNDAIPEPGWLELLLETVTSADDVAAACPKMLLNVWAHAVHVDAAPVNLPDGRRVTVGVRDVSVDGAPSNDQVTFDERFHPWSNDRHWGLVRWAKSAASLWWPVEADAVEQSVRLRVQMPTSGAVTVDGGADRTVVTVDDGAEVDIGGEAAGERDGRSGEVEVSVRVGPPVRIINSAGGGLYRGWFGGDRGFLEPDVGQYDEPAEVFSWCGGAVLLRVDYLREIGTFDPSYFLYYEDFELSWRGRRRGWRYLYDPRAVVLHQHAYSSGAGSDFFNFWVDRNRRLTLVRHAPWTVAVRAALGVHSGLARDVLAHSRQQARRLRPPSPRWMAHRGRSWWRVVSALPGAWRQRRADRRVATVGDRSIESWMITK